MKSRKRLSPVFSRDDAVIAHLTGGRAGAIFKRDLGNEKRDDKLVYQIVRISCTAPEKLLGFSVVGRDDFNFDDVIDKR